MYVYIIDKMNVDVAFQLSQKFIDWFVTSKTIKNDYIEGD